MAKSAIDRPFINNCRRELARASSLLEQRDYEQARSVCVRLLGDLDERGLRSSAAFRMYAVTLDNLGLLREALAAAERAVEADPLSPDAIRSRDPILERLRESLLVEAASEHVDEVLKRYDLLRERDEATVDVHVAAARINIAKGNQEGARKILAAVATLHPCAAEAWKLLEELGGTSDRIQVEEPVEVCELLSVAAGAA